MKQANKGETHKGQNDNDSKPSNWNGYDEMAVQWCSAIVPSQTATCTAPEGEKYKGTCSFNSASGLCITTVTKDGQRIARVVYDSASNQEQIFYGGDN